MKNKSIVSAAVITITLLAQILFVIYFLKISAWNSFSHIKDKLSLICSLSDSMPSSFGKFKKSGSTLLFSVPSVNPDNAVIQGSTDNVSVIIDNSIMIFSVYPSDISYRKQKTLYMKNAGNFSFNFAGDFFSLEYRSALDCFFHNYRSKTRYFELPSSGEVF